ncbi:hypothetical protein KUTeg_006199 [Tegillarca granosa]|uniref:Uncharacterized protein n=1 Tax=Tegillarca granosa TaxID=220873 RepID=A0ABQ9FKI4_TEGGR|nr:hypothetical protein KUTeg_006199 [Tegillarca granosa]
MLDFTPTNLISKSCLLRRLGKSVDLHLIDDLPHGFLNFALVSSDAKRASDVCVDKIRKILHQKEDNFFMINFNESIEVFLICDSRYPFIVLYKIIYFKQFHMICTCKKNILQLVIASHCLIS